MASLDYRTLLPPLLYAAANDTPQNVTVETCVVCDHDGGHYQIIYLGWDGDRRIYSVLLHVRVSHGKLYIERDGTTDGFTQTLLAAGMPSELIVLAFHPPYKRPLTAFAPA
ncbi:MAG: XisI protein [Chloroflexales bacterium]